MTKIHIWFVWLIVSLFYSFQYILRVIPSVFVEDITTKFQLSATLFGQFSGVYYLGYALMHLPVGVLLDRFGPKRVLPPFILLTVSGLLPLIYATSQWSPIAGRFIVGMGSSAAILGVFKIIDMSFPRSRFSMILSFSVILGLLGAIYGGLPVQIAKQQFGFESVLFILIGAGIALATLSYILIPKQNKNELSPISASSIWTVISNPQVLVMCILGGFMVGPLEGFTDVWGAHFLKIVYGYDDKTAAGLPSFIFFGMCVGGPILSFIAEKTKQYIAVVLSAAVIMAAIFVTMLLVKIDPLTLSILFFIVGICCAYQILVIFKVSTFVEHQHTGLATALANMIIMTFGYLFHSVIGRVISVLTDSTSLKTGIAVIPIAMLISIVGFSIIQIKHRISPFL